MITMAATALARSLFLCFALAKLSVYTVDGQFCAPELFEAKRWTLQVTHTDQGPDAWESLSTVSVDSIGQRLVSHETGTRYGRQYSVLYIYYYPAGTLFTVQDGVCTASPLTGNFTQICWRWDQGHVIAGFTKEYIGMEEVLEPIMGSISEHDGVDSLYSFAPEGDIPLFTGNYGLIDGVPTYRLDTYHNVTVGIRDPSVFTPPGACVKSQL